MEVYLRAKKADDGGRQALSKQAALYGIWKGGAGSCSQSSL